VGNQIWITQHYPSNVVEYDLRTGLWTLFPTSLVDFASTTLPYFVQATSTGVWFNEHYANRIAFIDPSAGTMTEFSEADPPITNETQLHNDLTIAAAPGGLWFTSATANYIGFVSGGQTEAFSLRTSTSNALSLSRNGSLTVHFQVTGSWNSQLKVQVSDSERITSVPDLITVQPGSSAIPAGSGPVDLGVTISANGSLAPGRYTVAVTLTDGLVYQTAFVFLTVT
jgi:streptogramin lyase